MLRSLIGLLLCANLYAGSFENAKITKATGGIIQQKGKIQTGSSSRVELEFPSLVIMRLGSRANFSASADNRKMTLKSGTLLASSAQDTGGITIDCGSVTTTMTKGAFEASNVGGHTKVIVLDGKVIASLAANPSERKSLRYGRMIDVPAGATTMPPSVAVNLAALLKTSVLFSMGSFPGSKAIEQNSMKQAPPRPFVTGGFDPDYNNSLTQTTPAMTAAMVARTVEASQASAVSATANAATSALAPGQIPTKSQVAAIEAAGLPVPNVSAADAQRILHGEKVQVPAPVPIVTPAPTPVSTPRPRPPRPPLRPPVVGPRPPVVVQPTPRPPVVGPPIAPP